MRVSAAAEEEGRRHELAVSRGVRLVIIIIINIYLYFLSSLPAPPLAVHKRADTCIIMYMVCVYHTTTVVLGMRSAAAQTACRPVYPFTLLRPMCQCVACVCVCVYSGRGRGFFFTPLLNNRPTAALLTNLLWIFTFGVFFFLLFCFFTNPSDRGSYLNILIICSFFLVIFFRFVLPT